MYAGGGTEKSAREGIKGVRDTVNAGHGDTATPRHRDTEKAFLSRDIQSIFLCVSLALCASAACRRPPATPVTPAALPQLSGTLALDGLRATVRVVRDRWGVPHIYASNQDDLFFARVGICYGVSNL